MPEIKCKAWNGKNMTISRSMNGWLDAYAEFEFDTTSDQTHYIQNWKWLFYTGRKDKTGKEIYDADIFTICDQHDEDRCSSLECVLMFVVFYSEELTAFCYGTQYNEVCGKLSDLDNIKVIGNMYENPNLLG